MPSWWIDTHTDFPEKAFQETKIAGVYDLCIIFLK